MAFFTRLRDGATDQGEGHFSGVSTDYATSGVVSVFEHFIVTAAGTARTVNVGQGVIKIPYFNYADSTNIIRYYEFINTASYPITLTANSSGNPRIDLICAKADTGATPGVGGAGTCSILYVTGTPAASPVAPAVPNNHIVIAQVYCAHNFTTLNSSDITDRRIISKLRANDDGWIELPSGFARVSNTSMTIPNSIGATKIFAVGDKLRYIDGAGTTYEYGYITSIPNDSTINFTGGSDYALAGTPSSVAVGKGSNAVGFPFWFNYAPTYDAFAPMTFTSVTTTYALFCIIGKQCTVKLAAIGTTGGTASSFVKASTPVTPNPAGSGESWGSCYVNSGGATYNGACQIFNSSFISFFGTNGLGNWTLGSGREIRGTITFDMV